jgi:hypothetical protein
VKKTLYDLLSSKEVTGKEVIDNIQEQEKRQNEFDDSIEFEERKRRTAK